MSIPLNTETLCNGGVMERLKMEMDRAIANIADPNTESKKVRKVKLEISIKPNEHRNMAELVIATSSTLQPPAPLESSIIIDKDTFGKAVAAELATGENDEQHILPDTLTKGKLAGSPKKHEVANA